MTPQRNDHHEIVNKFRPDLGPYESIYKEIHSNPELSGEEEETAARVVENLKRIGFEVHAKIGGHGVAAVLRNGDGPTVLLRADMDALPLAEKTGLPYASKKVVKNKAGVNVPVMHGCGHDTHVTSLLGSAELLYAAREHWAGTLVLVFQPAEEEFYGADSMLKDGLYDKVPKPDLVLAQHVMRLRTGTVSVQPGRQMTATDSFDVRIFGRGGHGSAPQACIDPIIIGASIITRLQSIVSREVTPGQLAIVTCGSIQGGYAGNIIPDECDIQISVRSFEPKIRQKINSSIQRIINAECDASGAKKPQIKHTVSIPATNNDEETVKTLRDTFGSYFGQNLVETEPVTASEDFSLLARAVGAPYVMWFFGGVNADLWDEAVKQDKVEELPYNHSSGFAPAIQPTLKTAIDAMALGALTFLNSK
ncbi:hypothetical protein BDV18DRAFT_168516 [Aspergillus unguis]